MLACVQCVDAGLGDTKQVDAAAAKCLGLAVGPFTGQNLTGGNPICIHGLAGWARTSIIGTGSRSLRKMVNERGLGSPGRGRKSRDSARTRKKPLQRRSKGPTSPWSAK